jgi:hypothetical protein
MKTTSALACWPCNVAEGGDDRAELGDVVLEVVEDLTRERVGEPDQDLRDRDETDHPEDRDR